MWHLKSKYQALLRQATAAECNSPCVCHSQERSLESRLLPAWHARLNSFGPELRQALFQRYTMAIVSFMSLLLCRPNIHAGKRLLPLLSRPPLL